MFFFNLNRNGTSLSFLKWCLRKLLHDPMEPFLCNDKEQSRIKKENVIFLASSSTFYTFLFVSLKKTAILIEIVVTLAEKSMVVTIIYTVSLSKLPTK